MRVDFGSFGGCRCLAAKCRGIQFEGGICKILFETTDVPQTERTKYNLVSLTSNGEMDILISGSFYIVLFSLLSEHIFEL